MESILNSSNSTFIKMRFKGENRSKELVPNLAIKLFSASLREIVKSRTISPHSLTYLLTDPMILQLPVTTYEYMKSFVSEVSKKCRTVFRTFSVLRNDFAQ